MCRLGTITEVPATAAEAATALEGALGFLAAADATSLTAAEHAAVLRALGRADSMHTAARSAVLSAFTAGRGFEADGQAGARSWLAWQTSVTAGAAAGAVGWARRLGAHPAVAAALAAAEISPSWARAVCEWTDVLPAGVRADADVILLAAAAGGAALADLAGLAEEILRRTAGPDSGDRDRGRDRDGFDERAVRLETTLGGAGRLDGDLTPQCAAALRAVLDALGKKTGPEDTRTRRQREHDALEEACRRLIAAGCLPQRAGQPTQIQLHLTLDQLRKMAGASQAEADWAAAQDGASASGASASGGRASADDTAGEDTAGDDTGAAWAARGPAAGPGYDCDAQIAPIVSGHIDPDILKKLAAALLRRPGTAADGTGTAGGRAAGRGPSAVDAARQARAGRAVRDIIAARAADLLSGPAGLAAFLRQQASGIPFPSVSLPLDVGAATDTIPAHLRRAVAARDRRCRFPGCAQPVAACQPHHLIPRSKGGPTRLTNLLLLCTFHHLIAVHRWGWGITLHGDGTITALSPDRTRTLHDHGPPVRQRT